MSSYILKKVGIVGHFGFGENLLNGQTIKTKIVTKALEDKIGQSEVIKVDTHGGKFAYLKLPFQIISLLRRCSNVIIMPAHNGIRVIVPLLVKLNKIFNRKLHYVVIGGWLPDMCKEKTVLSRRLKCFDVIYVETSTMKKAMEAQEFGNIVVMPNAKDLKVLANPVIRNEIPHKLCTFSRVMKEKGIEEAIQAVSVVNTESGHTVFTLDIYGQIDEEQKNWFENLKNDFPTFVKYKGCVSFDSTVDILKDYFALLFPTKFYTEGIPGTILDAYAAGVPVIASKWESFHDVIDDGITGLGYEFNDIVSFKNKLNEICENPVSFNAMKENALKKASLYSLQDIIKILVERL